MVIRSGGPRYRLIDFVDSDRGDEDDNDDDSVHACDSAQSYAAIPNHTISSETVLWRQKPFLILCCQMRCLNSVYKVRYISIPQVYISISHRN